VFVVTEKFFRDELEVLSSQIRWCQSAKNRDVILYVLLAQPKSIVADAVEGPHEDTTARRTSDAGMEEEEREKIAPR